MSNIKIVAIDGVIHISTEEFERVCADIRAEAIDEFFEMLKNPITLDRLTSSRDKIKTLSIIKYQYGVIKGDFKVGE